MTTVWFTTEDNADQFGDHVTLDRNATEEDIDTAIARVMRDLQTDHLHYAVVQGGKTYHASVSICRPVVEPDTPEG